MSDFFIVLAVAILGLMAQAAGGKRILRTVAVELGSSLGQPQTQLDAEAQAHAPSQFTAPSQSTDASVSSAASASIAAPASTVQTPLSTTAVPSEAPTSTEAQTVDSVPASDPVQAQALEPVQVKDPVEALEPLQFKDPVEALDSAQSQDLEPSQVQEPVAVKESTSVQEPAPVPVPVQTPQSKPSTLKPEIQGDSLFVVTNRKVWLEWILRGIIFFWFLGLALYFYISTSGLAPAEFQAFDPWVLQVTFVTCAFTGFSLVRSFRMLLSYVLSALDCLFDWSVLKGSVKNWATFKPAFDANRVFIPSSIPHMVGLFIYVQTMFYLLAAMAPKSDFQMPGMPIPLPLPLDQLFSYNGLGLVMLAFCGCGIFVTRKFKEVLQRLALVRPTGPQVSLGIGLILMSFLYDYLWALYTHGAHLGLDTKLSLYNGGTFTAEGGFTGALVLAIATAIFAGVGEETLIRGALQPVFGIVPAAILHGVLHAQFQHAPIFIVQVAGWSILMGIAKRYTNTTTTIIGHAGFNFVTTFLFAFNPPDI